jgi:hypothetical protein
MLPELRAAITFKWSPAYIRRHCPRLSAWLATWQVHRSFPRRRRDTE